jgi:hypothetical protein
MIVLRPPTSRARVIERAGGDLYFCGPGRALPFGVITWTRLHRERTPRLDHRDVREHEASGGRA